uniref:Methyltransferase-like protein (Trinotate prediction) n=1 Tax=Henneguya salminicola TaxID=69463 RepID=A0A6G3MKP0_HENSL
MRIKVQIYYYLDKLFENSSLYWDVFYKTHENKFFKDKNWLLLEFPELADTPESLHKKNIFEIGCGVGNIVFPLINATKQTFIYCCDYSAVAIKALKVLYIMIFRIIIIMMRSAALLSRAI